MARITKDWRDVSHRKIVEHTFKAEEAEMTKRRHAAFDEVIDLMLGPHKEAVEKMPSQWIIHTQHFVVKIKQGNQYNEIRITGAHPRPACGLPNWGAANDVLKRTPAAFEAAEAFAKAQADFDDRRRAFSDKVRTVLASVTTTKRLYEIWPELDEIVPQPKDDRIVARAHQLSTYVHELNKVIPLPTPKPAAKATKKTTKKVAKRA